MITLVLDCVDRLNVYNTAAHFSEYAGEEAAESWKEIVNLLYELLGVSICPLSYPFMVIEDLSIVFCIWPPLLSSL